MISLNLLPDIKRDYLNAKKVRDRVVSTSILVGGGFVGLVIVALIFIGAQWLIVDNTRDDIATLAEDLRGNEGVEDVLTAQNQLLALPGMHEDKPKSTRIFSYLSTLTPDNVSLSALELDMEMSRMEISGNAESVRDLNVLVDTLKGARYQTGPLIADVEQSHENLATQQDQNFSDIELSQRQPSFRNVVSSFSIDSGTNDVNFTVTLEFMPDIFDSSYSAVRMTVSDEVELGDNESDTIFEGSAEEGSQ